jgi:cell division control protein 6
MPNFEEILNKKSIIKDMNALSPHFIPDNILYRDNEIEAIARTIAPVFKNQKPRNLFVYGKTGTGKTTCVKYVAKKMLELKDRYDIKAEIYYMNCRVYDSRYKVMQNFLKNYYPEIEKSGFGLSYFYEKLIDNLSQGKHVVLILDEIDVIRDLDELIYTIIRVNDDLKAGSVSIVGISNKLGFKSRLDPRSKSSLYETEVIFSPYDAVQLRGILEQRAKIAFEPNTVVPNALSLIAAITAQESGDARYALKLLHTSAEIAEQEGSNLIEERHVENARRKVEYDIAAEAIRTLPLHHQLILYSLAKLTLNNKNKSLGDDEDGNYFFSGDLYQMYVKCCKQFYKKPKSARSYRDYINELESLGLVSTVFTSKGIRGHTRLVKIGHNPDDVIDIISKKLDL